MQCSQSRLQQADLHCYTGEASGDASATMQYVDYESNICNTHGVKIVGWPLTVPFKKPSSIGSLSDLTLLHSAVVSGELRWVKIPDAELAALRKSLKKKDRAPRSDAGVSRGPNAKSKAGGRAKGKEKARNESSVPAKRKAVTQKKAPKLGRQLPPKSRQMISDDDDSDDADKGSSEEEQSDDE